jgi:oxygen-independent coproporphyrinogen-3 oxidase
VTPLGLYIHVPFCSSICNYCNFNRGLFDAGLKDRYVRALHQEIRFVAERVEAGVHPVTGAALLNPAEAGSHVPPDRPSDLRTFGPSDSRRARAKWGADTIYFGGGTPSLLSPGDIGGLIDACRSAFDVAWDAEITLEANPETIATERAAAYRAVGVNRVSMGVQSFRDEELRRLSRVHDAARACEAVEAVRAGGIDNVSLDLMLWLPQQDVEQCLFSVRRLVSLQPEHASLYLLELYPNAPLKEEMARAGWSLAPDEDAAEMYLGAIEVLTAAGYEHYEISNFARPGRASRHNLKYWTDGEWLAFGCGAHSTMDGLRWKNVSATESYVAALEAGGVPRVAERFEEAAFTGLRLVSGLDTSAIERNYGIDVWKRYEDRLARFVEAGLLVREPGRLRLTPRGLLLSNEVMSVFIEEAGTVK